MCTLPCNAHSARRCCCKCLRKMLCVRWRLVLDSSASRRTMCVQLCMCAHVLRAGGSVCMCACVHVCMCRVAMQLGDTINQVLFYQGEGSQETSESDTFRSPATLYSPPTPPSNLRQPTYPVTWCSRGSSGSLRRAHARSCGRRVWSGNASGHKSQLEASNWSTVACLRR